MAITDNSFDKLWNYNQPEETRLKFENYLEKNKDNMPEDEVLQLKTQIARTYSLKLEFDWTHKILDDVERDLNDQTVLAKVRYLLERGRAFNSSKMPEKAKVLFIDAYEMAKNCHEFFAVDAAHMVAIAGEDLDEKIQWSDRGIELAKRSKDEKIQRWEGIFLNNTGWDLFDAERYEEALARLEQCRDFHQRIGSGKPLKIARWSVAKVKRYLGQVDESFVLQKELLMEGSGEDPGGYVFEELAELHLLKGEVAESKGYFAKAYEILSTDTWLKTHESARLERLKKLSF